MKQLALDNAEAERGVLGHVLKDSDCWPNIYDQLKPADFADARNRVVFKAMVALANHGKAISKSSLRAQIEEMDLDLGMYIAKLIADTKHGPVQELIMAILHAAGRRRIARAGDQIRELAEATTLTDDLEDVRQRCLRLLADIDSGGPSGSSSLWDLSKKVVSDTEAARAGDRSAGIISGYQHYDDLIGPMLPGRVVVIAGETGSGKTALATQIAVMVASQGIPVNMFSLEMDKAEITTRILAAFTEIEADRITLGQVSNAQLDRICAVSERTIDWPLRIDSTPALTVAGIQGRIATDRAAHGSRLAVVDHLQFVKPDDDRRKENEQIKQVVDDIKDMAKRLQIPVILISHISRQIEPSIINVASDIRRPILRDLYGSSAIEKAADSVLFVHRPYWFLERATPAQRFRDQHAVDQLRWEDRAELVVPKRRGGKGFATRECKFDAARTWFE